MTFSSRVRTFSMPDFTISLLWHPRMDADPAHRWLLDCVRDICADQRTAAGYTHTVR